MTGRGVLAAVLPLLVVAGAAQAELDAISARYLCERGVEIPVTYVNGSDGSAVVFTIEGRQIALLQVAAASGARYAWPSDGSGYVLWNKGAAITIYWRDGATGQETPVYAGCKAAP